MSEEELSPEAIEELRLAKLAYEKYNSAETKAEWKLRKGLIGTGNGFTEERTTEE